MKIKYTEIFNGITDEVPYSGVIIEYNPEGKNHSMSDKNLLKLLKTHIDIKCIGFKGEWNKQPLQFLRLLELNKANPLPIIVFTELTFEQFMQEIGIAMFEKVNKIKLDYLDDPMLAFMANMLVNYYLDGSEFFVQAKFEDTYRVYRINPPEIENEIK